MRRYEGMFLFDNAGARDWADVEQEIGRLCERIGAELVVCVKYDERKLAYEIERRKRGTYVLTYFDAPPDRIGDLERDVRLSESVLRVLVLQAEGLTEEKLAELKAHPADTSLQPASTERRHDYSDRGGPGPRGGGRFDQGPSRGDGKAAPAKEAPPEKAEAAPPVVKVAPDAPAATPDAPAVAPDTPADPPAATDAGSPEPESPKPAESEES